MKKIKCLFILALGFFTFSANAQINETRQQQLAERINITETFEGLNLAEPATNQQVTVQVKPSETATQVERTERPNATLEVTQMTVTGSKKSGVKPAGDHPAYDFSAFQQQREARRLARISNIQVDGDAIRQKIIENKSGN